MKDLTWFDRPTPTRYADIHIWKQATGVWRVLVTDAAGHTDITGPPYRTKAEALSVLDDVYTTHF
jgi:hypothetical protein